MTWSGSLLFSPGERLTSAKLDQLVENLRTHDHRFDDTRGTPVVRILTGVTTEARGASGFLSTAISFGSRFDTSGPTPRLFVSIDAASLIGSTIPGWGAINVDHAGADVRINRTNATNTPFRWLAVQALT
jgi:hypothetical protein